MGRGAAVAAGLLACASAALLAGCFDLFHSTADILSACELDAEAEACSQESPADDASPEADRDAQAADGAAAE